MNRVLSSYLAHKPPPTLNKLCFACPALIYLCMCVSDTFSVFFSPFPHTVIFHYIFFSFFVHSHSATDLLTANISTYNTLKSTQLTFLTPFVLSPQWYVRAVAAIARLIHSHLPSHFHSRFRMFVQFIVYLCIISKHK